MQTARHHSKCTRENKHMCLQDVEMPSEAGRESVEDMCMLFHTSVRTLAQDFLTQLQRHYYATPTSYL